MLSPSSYMLGLRAHTARGLQIKGLLVYVPTSWAHPPGYLPSPSSLGRVPLLCFPLMSHPYTVFPAWEPLENRDQCPFCFWNYTASTWATLSKSWKNWTDVPIAPNQSQPQPCLVLLLSLYWVVLSPLPLGNPVTLHLLCKLLSGPFISSSNCSVSDLSGGCCFFFF